MSDTDLDAVGMLYRLTEVAEKLVAVQKLAQDKQRLERPINDVMAILSDLQHGDYR